MHHFEPFQLVGQKSSSADHHEDSCLSLLRCCYEYGTNFAVSAYQGPSSCCYLDSSFYRSFNCSQRIVTASYTVDFIEESTIHCSLLVEDYCFASQIHFDRTTPGLHVDADFESGLEGR